MQSRKSGFSSDKIGSTRRQNATNRRLVRIANSVTPHRSCHARIGDFHGIFKWFSEVSQLRSSAYTLVVVFLWYLVLVALEKIDNFIFISIKKVKKLLCLGCVTSGRGKISAAFFEKRHFMVLEETSWCKGTIGGNSAWNKGKMDKRPTFNGVTEYHKKGN